MSLPVIVIATSKVCGHCVNMRGQDGSLKPENAPVSIPLKLFLITSMMAVHFFLVFDGLAIKLVNQGVNCSI